MKTTIYIGTIVLIIITQTLTGCSAQNYRYTTNYDYNRQYTNYDLSEYLDLEAVASVFSFSNDYQDFERRLNDEENNISNLDMNNDGYIDYLRVFKYTDNGYHIIMIQAVLGENYYQDVATMIIDPNRSYRRAVQIIGEPSLYGSNYIIEPEYRWEPPILRWMKYTRTYRYSSPYYWNYYPRYYTFRACVPMTSYYRHIRNNYYHHHRYYHYNRSGFSININLFDKYGRNDYWRDHRDRSFDYRYRDYDYRNRHDFDRYERSDRDNRIERNQGGSTGVINRNNNYSENERRENNSGGNINRGNDNRSNENRGNDNRGNTNQGNGNRPTSGTINRNQNERPVREVISPNERPQTRPERPAPVTNPQRPGSSTEQARPNTRNEQVRPEGRTDQVRPNTRNEQPRTSSESSGRIRPSNPEPSRSQTVEPKKETERSSGSSNSSESRTNRTTERTSGSSGRR